jgi:hypothetical protein
MCDKDDCHSCGKEVHGKCMFITLSYFTELVNSPLQRYRNFSSNTAEIEDDMVRQLQQNRAKVQQKHPLGTLNADYQSLIHEMFDRLNSQALTGKQAKQFCEVLKS